MTDNMHWAGNFKGEIAQIGNGTATATTGGYMSDFWSDFYKRIRRCNRFLEHVNSAYFIDEKERERMIAEAKISHTSTFGFLIKCKELFTSLFRHIISFKLKIRINLQHQSI